MCSDRYEGLADWYESSLERGTTEGSSAGELAELLGEGSGRCLDVGCGTGAHFEAISSTGRIPVGIDLSKDMLRLARRRSPHLVRADAARLPFRDGSFDTVVSTHLHTDVDDIAPVLAEVARVLGSEGRFVYLGVHPCFTGHFVEYDSTNMTRIIHAGYRDAGWHFDSPYFGHGIRSRVGYRHVPLSELLGAFIASGVRLERVEELQGNDPRDPNPGRLALVARKG